MKHFKEKIGRNDLCFCGSQKKHKHCCLGKEPAPKPPPSNLGNLKNSEKKKPIPRSQKFITGMAKASRLARRCLEAIRPMVKPGALGIDIDRFIFEYLKERNSVPATLNYQGYPASCCISRNEVVCHGIPNEIPFQEGDIVNVDLSPILNGYHGDISETFYVGECSAEAKKIVEVTRTCLQKGIEAIRPYGNLEDIGAAIQKYAHSQNCSVVERFVGHGIGKNFHEEPQVPHFGRPGKGPVLVPGMFFTIEPMINLGTKNVKILSDKWTAITSDRKLSAQFEHTVMVTKDGYRVLTAESDDAPFV